MRKLLMIVVMLGIFAFAPSNVGAATVVVTLTKEQVSNVCNGNTTFCTKPCGSYSCDYGCGTKGCSGTCTNCPGTASKTITTNAIRSNLTGGAKALSSSGGGSTPSQGGTKTPLTTTTAPSALGTSNKIKLPTGSTGPTVPPTTGPTMPTR
jgi:hypothetical protein